MFEIFSEALFSTFTQFLFRLSGIDSKQGMTSGTTYVVSCRSSGGSDDSDFGFRENFLQDSDNDIDDCTFSSATSTLNSEKKGFEVTLLNKRYEVM